MEFFNTINSGPVYLWPLLGLFYFYLATWVLVTLLLGLPALFGAFYGAIKYKQNPFKLFYSPFVAYLCTMFNVTSPIWMAFLVWFIHWDDKETPNAAGTPGSEMIRGDMTVLGSIFQTPDDRCPGDGNEPSITWYKKYGKYVCTWLWLGTRNRAMGLNKLLGEQRVFPAGADNLVIYGPGELKSGFWEDGNAWKMTMRFPGTDYYFIGGKEVYRNLDGIYWVCNKASIAKYA